MRIACWILNNIVSTHKDTSKVIHVFNQFWHIRHRFVLSTSVKEAGCLIHGDILQMKYADLNIALMSVRRKVWINIHVEQTPRILREALEGKFAAAEIKVWWVWWCLELTVSNFLFHHGAVYWALGNVWIKHGSSLTNRTALCVVG